MGISRSGYYKWKKREKSDRDIFREELIALVDTIHAEHKSHGYRWTAAYIRLEYGYECSDNFVYKCFRYLGIKAETKHQVHYRKRKIKDRYPNLIFTTWDTVDRPRQVIVSDMTAFKFWILYFEVTFYFDVFTKEILSYRIAARKGDRYQYGGMPSVVNEFIGTRNLRIVREEQQNIIRQYKADFVKYENDDKKLRIISIFDSIPAQLNQQNRRFIFTQLDKELKFNRYENSFLWLKDAAVAIPIYTVDQPKPPLILSKSTNQFKLFMGDVGLLTSCYPDYVSKALLDMSPDHEINNGALFENYIAQELSSCGITPYYFKSKSIGEIDFLIEYDNRM